MQLIKFRENRGAIFFIDALSHICKLVEIVVGPRHNDAVRFFIDKMSVQPFSMTLRSIVALP